MSQHTLLWKSRGLRYEGRCQRWPSLQPLLLSSFLASFFLLQFLLLLLPSWLPADFWFGSTRFHDFKGRQVKLIDILNPIWCGGSQPHFSPRLRCLLRCFNWKIPKNLSATCKTWHLIWLVIFPSCCSRQGPPLWNWGKFDHFSPLPTTLDVIWLQNVVPNIPFSYLDALQ